MDTPRRIRALTSRFRIRRSKALRDLCYTIYHQGTIYSASVEAVPFLLEIVAASDVPDRTQTLQILRELSTGCSFHEAHASGFFHREESKPPEWQEKVREEKAWVTAIHERLSAAVPLIAAVLQKGNASERLAAVSLLAMLQDNAGAVDALGVAALDADPAISASALSAIGARNETSVRLCEQCFERGANELVRTVAAIQILYYSNDNPHGNLVEYLLNHLRCPQPKVRKAYEALPDAEQFLGDLGKAFACAPGSSAEEAFPLLFEEVKRSPYKLNPSENFGILILAVALNPPPNRDWTTITLTPQQRAAIRMVADRAWQIDNGVPSTTLNIVEVIEKVGLPGKREALFALLAGTPEGAQTPKEEAMWSSWLRVF